MSNRWGWGFDCCCEQLFGYRIAGITLGGPAGVLTDRYDQSVDGWLNMTNMPSPARSLHHGFVAGGAIYSIGGTGTSPNHLRDNDQYIPDTWTSKTDCPSPGRRAHTGVGFGDLGYIFSGEQFTSCITDSDEYDTAGNSWSSITAALVAHFFGSAVAIGGAAYVFYYDTDNSSDLFGFTKAAHQYDPTGDSWSAKTSGPDPSRHRHAAFAIDGFGYIAGGRFRPSDGGAQSIYQDIDEFDPDGDSWASRTDMPTPARFACEGMTIGTAGYVMGGTTDTFAGIGDLDEYVVDSWVSRATNGSGASSHQCASL